MKNLASSIIILFLILSGSPFLFSQQDCSIDNSQGSGNIGNTDITALIQTFTAQDHGMIQSIAIDKNAIVNSGRTFTVELFEGPNPNTAPLLASQSAAEVTGFIAFTFDSPVCLSENRLYSIRVTSTTDLVSINVGGTNPGGSLTYIINDMPVPHVNHLVFIAYIDCDNACAPIPTLSQWGLIILSLCMMIIGVVSVNHRMPLLLRRS